ncbi:unnamed protein product [Schistosoma margrebowiei]|uniref:Uncharacterized protein n=1 Tax=Schistosoma margrebowiei TaxID=48269 RepID=A0A183LDX4_9TREM|nr:unnamed protein product [Schistosoma margrebowiei]
MVLQLMNEVGFYVSTAYGLFLNYCCGRPWYSRVSPSLIVGALPLKKSWDKWQADENITHIVSMLEPFEVKSFVIGEKDAVKQGIKYLSLPVRDFVGVPTFEQIDAGITFINSCVQSNGCVYIHCKAGRTRSAFLLTCYFMYTESLGVDEAIGRVKSFRRHIVFRSMHKIGLENYFKFLNDSKKSESVTS